MATLQYEYIVETGVIVPDTEVTKTEIESEYLATFGSDLVISSNTPQGVLISAETTARDEVVRNNAALANQINPNESGGVYLDAVMALMGIERTEDKYSTTPCLITGVPGTNVPAGSSQAKNANGDIFALKENATFDVDGNANVIFQAVLPGPISAQTGTLNTIYSGPLNWETITNTADATLGTLEQDDEEARQARRDLISVQGQGQALAIMSNLYTVPGVTSVSYRENVTSATQTIDGTVIGAHAIFICVLGGTDNDVATMILEKKNGGCGYSNNSGIPVTVNVTDPTSGQVYAVKFSRPNIILFDVQVTVSTSPTVIGDPATLVKNSIIAYVNSEVAGEPGLRIGVPVSSFELAGAINIQNPGLFVKSLATRIHLSGDPFSSDEIPIAIWQKASTNTSLIAVTVV